MKVTVDISNHSLEYVKNIQDAIESNMPFILYYDDKAFMKCYPSQLWVRCYVNGELSTDEKLNDMAAFIDRLKLGSIAYDKFHLCEDERPKLQPKDVKLLEEDIEEEIVYPDYSAWDKYLD